MPRLFLVPFVAILLASGCSAVSADVVARVDDEELTRTRLDQVVNGLQPDQPSGDAQGARDLIGLWVRVKAVQSQLATDGLEITDGAREDALAQLSAPGVIPGFEDFDPDLRDELVDWQVTLTLAANQEPTYIDTALAEADTWIKPRYGELFEGTILPLGLPTARQTAGE